MGTLRGLVTTVAFSTITKNHLILEQSLKKEGEEFAIREKRFKETPGFEKMVS